MRTFPPPPRYADERWHTCTHPVVHRLSTFVVLSGWLYWSLMHGWYWAVMQSQHFGPGLNLLMFCVLGVGWILLVVPGGCGALYTIATLGCGPWPTASAPPQAHRRGVERIVFSPDAAAQRFGIRGTVTIERELED
jgi:hypothetical protein